LVDEYLANIREAVKKQHLLIEIPPIPWEYPYSVALTHDVDVMSVRERGLPSVGAAVWRALGKGKISDAVALLLGKSGLGRDPWDLFGEWMALERNLGVRSTFFFIPFPNRPGIAAPEIRASRYEVNDNLLDNLRSGGWEIGVHGIDNWRDEERGLEERERIAGNERPVGSRVHWLWFDEGSWARLDRAGYSYDSTFGYNHDVGFRAGTLQVYRPRSADYLLELPLHIQDAALFGTSCYAQTDRGWDKTPCLNLDEEQAMERCSDIFRFARIHGGVVTILWHYESIGASYNRREFYERLVRMGTDDGAWVTRAGDIVEWFRIRREAGFEYRKEGSQVTITMKNLRMNSKCPCMRIRVHCDPSQIAGVDGEYLPGPGYIDIKCDREEFTVRLR
jgi:hypothetical protein